MKPGDCIRCGLEIDDTISDAKKKFAEKMGVPYVPPKVCSACIWKRLTEPDFGVSSPHPEEDNGR